MTEAELLREACLSMAVGSPMLRRGSMSMIRRRANASAVYRVSAPRETEDAVAAAARAMPAWAAKTARERSLILRRWYELIIEHQESLARILTREQGKPLAEARGEVAYAAGFIEWFGEEAKRVYGDVIPGHQADKRIVVIKQPIGVVAAITPWNFPAAMITRKLGPALAVGCSVVLKPASATPFTALALAVLAEQAGVPAGVINVITGSAAAIAGVLTSSPIVAKISFTGSTEIGAQLFAESAPTIKTSASSWAATRRSSCSTTPISTRRSGRDGVEISQCRPDLRPAPIGSMSRTASMTAFVAKLVEAVNKLKVGNGAEDGVTIGPLIDDKAVLKAEEHVADALSRARRWLPAAIAIRSAAASSSRP